MNNSRDLIEKLKESVIIDDCIFKYRKYLTAHIDNVQKAWNEEVSKIDDEFIYNNRDSLTKQIEQHDKSKWDDAEFDAYRANYYPINDDEKINNEANFQAAWFNHFQNNPHHWQHWLDEEGILIPLENLEDIKKYYVEMICDWQAMGYVFGDTAKQYYDQNKDTIQIYSELKDWLEDILSKLEGIK